MAMTEKASRLLGSRARRRHHRSPRVLEFGHAHQPDSVSTNIGSGTGPGFKAAKTTC